MISLFFSSLDGENHDPEDVDCLYYDKVVFATGSFIVPSIPVRESDLLKKRKGASFDKPVLHSSQTKSLGGNITGKTFLFIGSSYSSEDLILSFIKRGANHIYVTTRSDLGYPVAFTNSWPMNKVTVFMRTEIKQVLPENQLRLGRMDLPSPAVERIVKNHYNASHND